jgi:hypothetical protein
MVLSFSFIFQFSAFPAISLGQYNQVAICVTIRGRDAHVPAPQRSEVEEDNYDNKDNAFCRK